MRPVLVTCLVLAACGPIPPEPRNACGAFGYQSLVGQPLAAVTLPAELGTRIVGPDTAVTLDHRAQRLTIEVDGSGRITEVRCG